jgi:NAD(P)-dependent dehydrogenase (short-subunit alcohol dehydrogenase family)
MSNPVVLITGALSGIGRAAAVAFAKKGAKVVVAGRRDEAGKALVKELRSFGSEAEFINADVRKEDDVRALVDKTVARFGRLDVAVNNAGTEGQVGPITDQTAERLCRDVRHECSRRDPEHEARSARHARTGQR